MSQSEHISKIDISGAIAILSTMFAGSVLICFPRDTFLKVVTNVFGDIQTEINKDNSDATGELANIIYGQAKTILVDELDIDFMKSRSYAIEGSEKVKSYQTSASFVVPFESELGPFYLVVSFDTIREEKLVA
jgi:chemotaxis protein CheX